MNEIHSCEYVNGRCKVCCRDEKPEEQKHVTETRIQCERNADLIRGAKTIRSGIEDGALMIAIAIFLGLVVNGCLSHWPGQI